MRTDNTSGQFVREKTRPMNLTQDMRETIRLIDESVKVMTPNTKQREVMRITSNLPEVYSKYFYQGEEQDSMQKKPFSLNKTQKELNKGPNTQTNKFQKTPRGTDNMQSRRIYYDEDSKLNFTSDDMLGTEPLNSIDSPTKSFLLRKQRTLANQDDGRATD